MRALCCGAIGQLIPQEVPIPQPGPGAVLVRVLACGVCRTDLHVVDRDLPMRREGVIPGHEIVGRVVTCGPGVTGLQVGERIGIPWLGHTCGQCRYCLRGQENLCDRPGFTGWTRDGGYADYTVADARYCLRLPAQYSDLEAAPLLCAGLIGYRAFKLAQLQGAGQALGLYGFGAAAHLVAQVARQQGHAVYVFTRPGDTAAQDFARQCGAVWAGDSDQPAPVPLAAALIFAPVGDLVVAALRAVDKGGRVVCAGIHMSDIPAFAYALLWEERSICSVANLTRADGSEFMALAGQFRLEVTAQAYPLVDAQRALDDLRAGRFTGAAVLVP